MEKNDFDKIRIRVYHPDTNDVKIYGYLSHKICRVKGSSSPKKYRLLIKAVKLKSLPLREVVELVSDQVGTKPEMEELWVSAYKKAEDSNSLGTVGIEFGKQP